MNAKKYLTLVVLGIMVVLPFLNTGCKVGDEDPFISFQSRKARITGVWTVTQATSDVVRKENNVNTKTLTTIADGKWNQEITIQGTDSVRKLEGKITVEPNNEEGSYYFDFDKNGKVRKVYKYEFNEDISAEDADASTIIITKVTEEITGTWNFLAAIDDYKNKERLAIVIEDRKTTTYVYRSEANDDDEGATAIPVLQNTYVVNDKYANGEMSTIYEIVSLKGKSIKLHQNIDSFYVETNNGVGASYQDNGYELLELTPRK